jgi:hypothetical protein
MLVRTGTKNRITLPKAIVRELPDVEYFEVSLRKGAVVLRPVVLAAPCERLKVVHARIKGLGITRRDVQGAIRWARRRRG